LPPAGLLNRYLLPELGGMRMLEIQAADVRQWVTRLTSVHGARPPTVRRCKQILDAIPATALNDQVTYLHAGKDVKTPPVATKPRRIITAERFERVHTALGDASTQLLVETAIESGLRWGELTELRVSDLDFESGLLPVCRAVVELRARSQEPGTRFLVKQYPKDREWRQLRLAPHMVTKIRAHVAARCLGADCLLFEMPEPDGPARRSRQEVLPDPETLGLTPPNSTGLRYRRGHLDGSTPTATSVTAGSGATSGDRQLRQQTSAFTSPLTDCGTLMRHGCLPGERTSR
jgi:integrase